jgi:hypothetical protein
MGSDLRQKLVDSLRDAHAMGRNMLHMLDSMIATTDDRETTARVKQHRAETINHEQLRRGRPEASSEVYLTLADAAAVARAVFEGVDDHMQSDKVGKNARDGDEMTMAESGASATAGVSR